MRTSAGDGKGGDALKPLWRGSAGLGVLGKMAATLGGDRAGLLALYVHRISTGPLDGTSLKTKTMRRQAYGFRDRESFKLKILAIHEPTHALDV